jgi:hypothetical protein
LSAGGDFEPALARLSRWRLLIIWSWAAFLPAEMTIGYWLGSLDSAWPFVAVGVVIVALFIYGNVRITLFDCPRCGRRYTSKPSIGFVRYSNLFTTKCLHCGLERPRKVR